MIEPMAKGIVADGRRFESRTRRRSFRIVDIPRKRLAVVVLGAAFLLVLLYSHSSFDSTKPSTAVLYSTNKVVDGTVYDSSMNPISSASVTITVKYSGGGVRYTYPSPITTDSYGFYQATIEGVNWDPGNIIEVAATYGSDSGTNSAVADSEPGQTIDVVIGTAIPEFSSSVAVVVAMLALLVGASRVRAGRDGR